jgi:hypothetical protein
MNEGPKEFRALGGFDRDDAQGGTRGVRPLNWLVQFLSVKR